MSFRLSLAAALAVAAAVLAMLVATRHHHAGGRLEITADAGGRAPLGVAWDSGEGFNRRERTVLLFGRTEPLPQAEHRVVVANASPATPDGGPPVFVQAILLDESLQLDLAAVASSGELEMTEEGLLRLPAGGVPLAFGAEFKSLRVRLLRGPDTGWVRIEVDADSVTGDLRAMEKGIYEHAVRDRVLPGPDTRTLPLPRTAVEGLEIVALDPEVELEVQAVRFVTGMHTIDLDVEAGAGAALRWTGLEVPTRTFSGLLLAMQILVALCAGGASLAVMRLPGLIGRPDWSSTWRFLFREDGRWAWWAMFAGSTAVFGFWLAGQWPGSMLNDSFTVWVQLKTLEINNLRPWPYVLWLLALMQIADHPAVVGIVQVLISAALGSSVLFYCLRRGVSWPTVFLFWLLFTCSIPVGLYNVTHIKDVPFAQCTLLWGFILFRLWLRREDGRSWDPRPITVIVFAVLLMGFLTRHNGLLFVFVIPALVLACGLMSRRRAVLFLVASASIFALLQVGVANLVGVHERTDYARFESWMKLAPVLGLFAHTGGYYTDDPEGDRQRIEQMVDVETIRRDYQRGSFEPIFYRYRLADAEEMYRQVNSLFDRRVAENLPILIGDKAYLFATVIGPFRGAYLWSNDLHDRRFLRQRVYVDRRLVPRWGEMTMLHRLAHRPLWPAAYRLQRQIWEQSRDFRGLMRGRFVMWNALVPFTLLATCLAAYRWLPATALFALVVLFQAPFVFLGATAYSYRFIYFIVYAGYFVVPLALVELSRQKSDA